MTVSRFNLEDRLFTPLTTAEDKCCNSKYRPSKKWLRQRQKLRENNL